VSCFFETQCTYIHTNLYSAKNRENESEALAQNDYTVKADWKRWNFRWRLKVDSVSIERKLRGIKCFPGGETQFVGNTMTNSVNRDECSVS